MGVPAHDQRDFEFAKKYGLKIKEVVKGGDVKEKAYDGSGELTNSGDFDGLDSVEGKEHIIKALEFKKLGRRTVNFKLRDWLISRQRFWGTPIPIIYCDRCGIVPVSEKDLPVKLPDNIKFESERNPLTENKKFIDVKCPKCKGKARRETDTMDTFVNSSWYYLRYLDSKNKKKIFDSKKANYWMPIDMYIGGKEHATMHLIYFRFFTNPNSSLFDGIPSTMFLIFPFLSITKSFLAAYPFPSWKPLRQDSCSLLSELPLCQKAARLQPGRRVSDQE